MKAPTSVPSIAGITTSAIPGPDGDVKPSYLVVFRGDSSSLVTLPHTGALVIGRSSRTDLQIDDNAASRKHATLHVVGGDVVLQDLGSQNGTFVNGERVIGSRTLLSEDVITIGGAQMVFHASARVVTARVSIELHELRAIIEQEIERARESGRTFAVVALAAGDGAAIDDVRGALEPALRRIDRIAQSSTRLAFACLPELDPDDAPAAAKRLGDAAGDARLAIGYAVYPRDGATCDTLLASARGAVEAAKSGAPAGAHEAFTIESLGERTAVIADAAMTRLYELLRRLAASDLPVLVTGETGTGKELAAAALHHHSPRADKPLVTLNCAAIAGTLIESELFGHEKGAFSGATSAKPGLLEASDGGTLFLDEIGELPLEAQAKLLRALENKSFLRVGGLRERVVDVRFVAATNRDLAAEAEAGRFRADLLYRLNAATVYIPPLRDRRREIPILARRFAAEVGGERGAPALSDDALEALAAHDWPGNVRELRNAVAYLAATALTDEVDGDEVRDYLTREPAPASATTRARPRDRPRAPAPDCGPGDPAPGDAAEPPREFQPLKREVEQLERTRIAQALAATRGNQTHAAKLIGTPLRTFIHKAKRYGLLGNKDS